MNLELDNVTYVLNVLDELAGDDRFIDIRKRRRVHRPLSAVENKTEQARRDASAQREQFMANFDKKRTEEAQRLDDEIQKLQQRQGIDIQQMALELQAMTQARERRLTATTERLERERDEKIERIEQDLSIKIRDVQQRYKMAAVAFPPILPLGLAVVVYARRRRIENLGAPQRRIKN